MNSVADGLMIVLTYGLPPLAFVLALRQGNRTRGQLLVASTFGGLTTALIFLTGVLINEREIATNSVIWIFAFGLVATGFIIGVLLLVAREFGAWLSRRPGE
jgi:hypothetical protein